MTYEAATDYLQSLGQFGMELGLDRIAALCELAGNPQQGLKLIHVAGTNGKGSTCAFLESVYRTAGFTTGLYTSPHLVSFTERIQIDRQNISEEEVSALVSRIKPWVDTLGSQQQPTFFEFVTLMALCHFAQKKPDVVIWETGLGGRLDATNIVTPILSLITNIQLDHQQWLGTTLVEIAREKAGIIKPGVPVLLGPVSPEVYQEIEIIAQANESRLMTLNDSSSRIGSLMDQLTLPMLGRHQRINAALAAQAIMALDPYYPIGFDDLKTGLCSTYWPGRLQRVQSDEGRELLLDGAHNPAGIHSLCETLEEEFPERKITLIFGVLEDKDWRLMARELGAFATRIITVPVPSPRTVSTLELSGYLKEVFPNRSVIPADSLAQAMQAASTAPFILVAGSLYLIGETLAFLNGHSAQHDLNQWTMKV